MVYKVLGAGLRVLQNAVQNAVQNASNCKIQIAAFQAQCATYGISIAAIRKARNILGNLVTHIFDCKTSTLTSVHLMVFEARSS